MYVSSKKVHFYVYIHIHTHSHTHTYIRIRTYASTYVYVIVGTALFTSSTFYFFYFSILFLNLISFFFIFFLLKKIVYSAKHETSCRRMWIYTYVKIYRGTETRTRIEAHARNSTHTYTTHKCMHNNRKHIC